MTPIAVSPALAFSDSKFADAARYEKIIAENTLRSSSTCDCWTRRPRNGNADALKRARMLCNSW